VLDFYRVPWDIEPRTFVLEEDEDGRVAVPGELDEVDLVKDRDRAREVGEEDEARLQERHEEEVAVCVVLGDLRAELTDAPLKLLGGEKGLADTGVFRFYEARSNRYRWASRSMSRL
jgi:hypothetical protein